MRSSKTSVAFGLMLITALSCAPERPSIPTEGPLSISWLRPKTVWAQDQVALKAMLTNTSDNAINISGFKVGCPCMKITPQHLALGPNDSATLDISLALSERKDLMNLESEVRTSFVIVPEVAAEPRSHGPIYLPMNVRTSLLPKTLPIVSRVPLVYGRRRIFDVDIDLHPEVNDIKVAAVAPISSVEITERHGRAAVVRITMDEMFLPGAFSAEMTFTSYAASGKMLSSITFPVRGEMLSPVLIEPKTLTVNAEPEPISGSKWNVRATIKSEAAAIEDIVARDVAGDDDPRIHCTLTAEEPHEWSLTCSGDPLSFDEAVLQNNVELEIYLAGSDILIASEN